MPPTAENLSTLQFALADDLLRFAPELAIVVTIVALLLARLLRPLARVHLGPLALAGSATALGVLLAPAMGVVSAPTPGTAFSGLLQLDAYSIFLRGLLLTFALLAVVLTRLTRIPDAEDSADFYTLFLGGILGMCVMVSADHLLMVFLGLEMASLPSYALAGFLKGRRQGSEAALKYVVYGAASSGVTLYGISLLTAAFGTGHLPAVTEGYAKILETHGFTPMIATGTLFLLVGLGFKLSAVPFHFWLPDVFEGAAAEVGAFLSVASKAAAVGLTARILLALQSAVGATDPTLLPRTVGLALAVVAAVTATFGNLAALPQTNLKRMLAYSTIAHAGYMLMGLATLTHGGTAAVLFYLAAYLLMNLGAFGVVAVVRNHVGDETLDAFRGLWQRSPTVAVTLGVFLASLLGIPPLAGFAGKFQVFAEVFGAGRLYQSLGDPWLGTVFAGLLGVGVVNTLVSAGFYLRVLRAAGLDDAVDRDEKQTAMPLGESAAVRLYLGLLAVGLFVLGVLWGPLTDVAGLVVVGM